MPAWTTIMRSRFVGLKSFLASSGRDRYKVQIEGNSMLVRLERNNNKKGNLFALSIGDILRVYTSKIEVEEIKILHVQHLPSWKRRISSAIVKF